MRLFKIENDLPVVTAEALLIPEFSALYERDKTKGKSKAVREIAYIYFSVDYQSIYLSYTREIREERLSLDFMGDKDYKPDELVLAAMQKYDELQQTPTMNFLRAARNAMQSTEDYFNNIDYNLLDFKGQPVYKIKDITSSLGSCSKIKEAIDKLIEAVKKEQSNGDTQRGGGTGGMLEFED